VGFVTRVAIADDHPALRESLRAALRAAGDFQIAGEAATGRDALRLARDQKPDVIVLDLHMPDMDGIAAAAKITGQVPAVAVVIQSLSYGAPYVLKALGAGVRGFVAKEDGIESLLHAIRLVWANQCFLSPAVAAELQATTRELFSEESVQSLLGIFDREAPALWQYANAVTSDPALAREALMQSFLAYAIARLGADPIPNVRVWLLLSLISSLYSRKEALPLRPVERMTLGAGLTAAGQRWRAAFQGHANRGDFTAYWRGTLPAISVERLRAHLRRCPSCHLEWCLFGFAQVGLEQSPTGPEPAGAPAYLRAQLADELTVADLGLFARAWSAREKRVRRLMASELRVLLGSTAASGWIGEEDSALPVNWTAEFLGSRARRASAAMQTAIPTTPGLGR
jgi:DNA-binding NarL/FixJ family response regulator